MDITPVFSFEVAKELSPLLAAYSKAKQQMGPLVSDKTARVASAKGNYSYNYASLASILNLINEAAFNAGLVYVQNMTCRYPDGGKPEIYIERYISHPESGAVLLFAPYTLIPYGSDAQAIGSAQTYARRYCAMSDWGIDDEDDRHDDDGGRASGKEVEIDRRPPQQQQQRQTQAPAGSHRGPVNGGQGKPVVQQNSAQGKAAPTVDPVVPDDSGEKTLLDQVQELGMQEYGAANWVTYFNQAITNWERKRRDEVGRAPVGSLEAMNDADREDFLRGTIKGLNAVHAAKVEKAARLLESATPVA